MTATFQPRSLRERSFPIRQAGSSGVNSKAALKSQGVLCANLPHRPGIITTPLTPLTEESPTNGTWERVINLLRLGAYAIALAGLIKTTGLLVKTLSAMMLLFHYFQH